MWSRPILRTRSEVIEILERALAAGGDDGFDDFVSIEIADLELEGVRLKCLEVALAPNTIFDQTLRRLIGKLKENIHEK